MYLIYLLFFIIVTFVLFFEGLIESSKSSIILFSIVLITLTLAVAIYKFKKPDWKEVKEHLFPWKLKKKTRKRKK